MKSNAVVLVCPKCHLNMSKKDKGYICSNCMHVYPIYDDVPSFMTTSVEEGSFNKKNFELLFEMEQKHFWHKGRREIIYNLLQQVYRDRLLDITMIEIGCGNGSVLQYLKGKGINIEGGDLFLQALRFCRRRVDTPLYQLDAKNTPFADEQYDVVGLFDVIEHLDYDTVALREIHRICKVGGRIILTVPANDWLWSYFDVISCHKRRYSKKDLYHKLRNSGFVVEKISFYLLFLFPVFSLYRLFRNMNYLPNEEGLASTIEVRTIPFVNRVFFGTLKLERLLIKFINLPLGTSLIAIARKV